MGHGLLIFEVSRSHSDTPHSVGILWTTPSHRRLSDNTQYSRQTAITGSGGYNSAILASERQQTHRLDRTAGGIVWFSSELSYFIFLVSCMIYKILRFNPLNAELNPICYLLALLGAHNFLHVSRIRVKSLTLRLLMSYIYIYIYIWSTYSWCF